METARPLRDVFADLTGSDDGGAHPDPAAVLQASGHEGLPAGLVAEAVGSYADTAPIEVAEHLSPYVMAHSAVPLPDAPDVEPSGWLDAVVGAPHAADFDDLRRTDEEQPGAEAAHHDPADFGHHVAAAFADHDPGAGLDHVGDPAHAGDPGHPVPHAAFGPTEPAHLAAGPDHALHFGVGDTSGLDTGFDDLRAAPVADDHAAFLDDRAGPLHPSEPVEHLAGPGDEVSHDHYSGFEHAHDPFVPDAPATDHDLDTGPDHDLDTGHHAG
jgi:hypothetical protein